MTQQYDLEQRILPLHVTPHSFKYDLSETHNIIINKLLQDSFTVAERYALAPFVRVLGIPELQMETYKILWEGGGYEVNRTILLSIIFHTEYGDAEFRKLTELERIEMSDPWVYPMFTTPHVHEGFAKMALSSLVASTSTELRPLLAKHMESIRKNTDATVDIYSECWAHENFALPF
jgi:hypothetical protein